jgi:hypothetical protein
MEEDQLKMHKQEGTDKGSTAGNYDDKLERIKQCILLLKTHKNFLDENTWTQKFEVNFATYFNQTADPNLKVFMGYESGEGP